jgi:carbohydrate-binding DOMON domain-containing protein
LATVLTTTETVTTTATATKVVTSTVTVEKTTTATVEKTTTVTITETKAEDHTATVTYTVTGVEVVREVDLRGVVLAFLGVAMLGVSLIIFIISEKRRRV